MKKLLLCMLLMFGCGYMEVIQFWINGSLVEILD